ncbi:MAG: pilus assembly protein PilP [Calditerrivibrio sp.]|nr:pilus assembly protein PilP [Calditerrivibrio sp.]
MRYFVVLAATFLVLACTEEPPKQQINPVINKKMEPAKVNVDELLKQEEELKALFRQKSEPLNYRPKKDPFRSVVEVYKETLANQFSENPLRNASLDQIKLVGVLNSKVGSVGVVEISGQTFYVKVGDKIGFNDGIIVDINDKNLRIRQMEKDIFGNMRAVIKDIAITESGGKQ